MRRISVDESTGIYYNGKGKYESNARVLQSLLPKQGVSSNKYLACFGTMVRIYADVYNNGWGGNNEMFEKLFKQCVRPVMGERFGNFKKFYNDMRYLEGALDKTILKLIQAEDFKFQRQAFFFKNAHSMNVATGRMTSKSTLYLEDMKIPPVIRVTFNTYADLRMYLKENNAELKSLNFK